MSNVLSVKSPCDEGVVRAAPPSTPCGANAEGWVLAATILGSSMAFIDGTVVNVALPVLQDELRATAADAQWIVESYTLFLAALMLVGGTLGDRFGRRLVFAIGVALFGIASIACGLAANAGMLVAARAAQGVGGALLVPGSLAILSASFGPERRGQAIGTWSGFTAITGTLGPVLGGWLIEQASWRWAFFINVPIGLIVIGIVFTRVPESRSTDAVGLDWPGAVLVASGLGVLVWGLIESSTLGLTDARVLTALGVGVLLLLGFIGVEARTRSPMVPLGLFGSRTFSGANLMTLFLYAAMGGAMFFLPFNLIQVQGYSTTAASTALLPLILLIFLLSRWSGGLVDRYGPRRPLVIGSVIAALGFGLFAVPGIGGSYWTTVFPAAVVLGLGMSITVAPLTTTVLGAVGEQRAGIASAINNAVSRTAGLLAIAILSIFLTNAFNRGLDERLLAIDLAPEIQQALDGQRARLAGAKVPDRVSAEVQADLKQAIAESYLEGYRLVMLIATGLALASAFVALVTIDDAPIGKT